MTRRQYQSRQQRIREGRCPRCNKPVDTWPIRRPDNCGLSLNTCMRSWRDIVMAEERITVKE